MTSKKIQIPQFQPLLSMLNLKTLYRQEGKSQNILVSRSFVSAASTAFLIIVSLLPYFDIFIGMFINTDDIKINRFGSFSAMIWSYSMCVSPPLILLASKFKPYWFSYIVPCYVYTTMFCGFLFLDLNINISSDWVFRLVTFILSLIVFVIAKHILKIFRVMKYKEDLMDEFIKHRRNG